ncbi:hypothetical protein DQ04_05211010, partial [Trypanosoma grayi]|uniref:hypothetical protein n=1 Tax=Trypanosoma grayi TaxID=71804 RepID=UPI0004F3F57D
MRTQRNLEDRPADDGPLYCVTLEEYTGEKNRAQRLQEQLDFEKEQHAQLQQLFSTNESKQKQRDKDEETKDQNTQRMVRLLESKNQQLSDNIDRTTHANEKLTNTLAQKEADIAALTAEVEAFRRKRHEALGVRQQDGQLDVAAALLPPDRAAAAVVDPAVIAQEPLYCVTIDE